jgi:Predicted solute binding protein
MQRNISLFLIFACIVAAVLIAGCTSSTGPVTVTQAATPTAIATETAIATTVPQTAAITTAPTTTAQSQLQGTISVAIPPEGLSVSSQTTSRAIVVINDKLAGNVTSDAPQTFKADEGAAKVIVMRYNGQLLGVRDVNVKFGKTASIYMGKTDFDTGEVDPGDGTIVYSGDTVTAVVERAPSGLDRYLVTDVKVKGAPNTVEKVVIIAGIIATDKNYNGDIQSSNLQLIEVTHYVSIDGSGYGEDKETTLIYTDNVKAIGAMFKTVG